MAEVIPSWEQAPAPDDVTLKPTMPATHSPDDAPLVMQSTKDLDALIQSQVGTPEPPPPQIRTSINPEGKAPKVGMSFGQNVEGAFKSMDPVGALADAANLYIARNAQELVRGRGYAGALALQNAPLGERDRTIAMRDALSPKDIETRRADAEKAVYNQIAYELGPTHISPSSVAGTVASQVPLFLVGGLEKAAALTYQGMKRALPGAPEWLMRMVGSGTEGAAINSAIDASTQAVRAGSGAQDEYNPYQTAVAAAGGFGLTAAVQGARELSIAARARAAAAKAARPLEGDILPPEIVPPTETPPSSGGVEPPTIDLTAEGGAASPGGASNRTPALTGPKAEEAPRAAEAPAEPAATAPREAVPEVSPAATAEEIAAADVHPMRPGSGAVPKSLGEIEALADRMGVSHAIYENENQITVSKIVVPKEARGEGTGSAVMQAIVDYADEAGKRVVLTPDGSFGGSVSRLKEFYKRFGFVENKGKNKDFTTREGMIRDPQAPDEDTLARRASPRGAPQPDRDFAAREELKGEGSKPRVLPADATPDEIHDFHVTDELRNLAEILGRRLEVDGRFTLRGALGEYKTKEGVLRIRHEGDLEVFSHEAGHAIDQDLARDVGTPWNALRRQYASELRPLDANTSDPAKQTVTEGIAEYLRMAINNPAFAAKQAPGFTQAFNAFVNQSAPHVGEFLNRAQRVSQIDSGMDPMDAMRSTVRTSVDSKGVEKFAEETSKHGIVPTLGMWFERFYKNIVAEDRAFMNLTDALLDARFKKTGKPMEREWDDPYKRARSLPAARQLAMDQIYQGVRPYGNELAGQRSIALYDGLSQAFNGDIHILHDPKHPLKVDFDAYLMARTAMTRYEDFVNGDIEQPPIRRSREITQRAIADFEKLHPQFKEAADKVFEFTSAVWERKYAAGLIESEIYNAVTQRGRDYVPMFRDMRDDSVFGGKSSSSSERGLKGHKFGGSTRDVLSPIEQISYDLMKTEVVIARNNVINALDALRRGGEEFAGKWIESVPNTELKGVSVDALEALTDMLKRKGVTPADRAAIISQLEQLVGDDTTAHVYRSVATTSKGERIVFGWKGGKRYALKLANNEIGRAVFDWMERMGSAEQDLFIKLASSFNTAFQASIVNASSFGVGNIVADAITRPFIGRNVGIIGRIPGAALVQAMFTNAFDKEFAQAYAALGGIRGAVISHAAREVDAASGVSGIALKPRGVKDNLKGVIPHMVDIGKKIMGRDGAIQAFKTAFGVMVSPVTVPFKLLNRVAEGSESAGRLGHAALVYKYLKKQGFSDVNAVRGAIFEARDLVDYDRTGRLMKFFNRIFPFLRPGIVGTARGLQALFGEPLRAAGQAYRRGGYAALDADMKSALKDAAINWGFVAAALAAVPAYHALVKDDEIYRRKSPYMKRRYYIFGLKDGGNPDGSDDELLTIRKPFDIAGALISSFESALDGIYRADPKTYSNMWDAFKDGILPRQFQGIDAIVGAQPHFKTGAEYLAGRTIGYEGVKGHDIVPQDLKGQPVDRQFRAETPWIARWFAGQLGASPMVVDHVLTGLGATMYRDASALIDGISGHNPNMTFKDALTQATIGMVYRRQRGVGNMGAELREQMGRDGGSIMQAANGYKAAIEGKYGGQDFALADRIYNAADDLTKATILLTAYPAVFKSEVRQINPLIRAETILDVAGSIARSLSSNQVEKLSEHRKVGAQHQFITVEPEVSRAFSTALNALTSEEIRNSMTVAGKAGYENFNVTDLSARYAGLKDISPELAAEFDARLKNKHVLSIERLQAIWPEARDALLQDKEKAKISSLVSRARR